VQQRGFHVARAADADVILVQVQHLYSPIITSLIHHR
jgi:hypothetical protein